MASSVGDPPPVDALWQGFAGAVVRVALPTGPHRLAPVASGTLGRFPFSSPVHIITAHNPGGAEIDAAANAVRHRELHGALAGQTCIDTVGSAPDGSMAEPGFGVLDIELDVALDLGRRFGQVAIYRWTPETLSIVGVDDPTTVDLGWALTALDG